MCTACLELQRDLYTHRQKWISKSSESIWKGCNPSSQNDCPGDMVRCQKLETHKEKYLHESAGLPACFVDLVTHLALLRLGIAS